MSLAFPASPVNGQVYQSWIFNSTSGAWEPNFASMFVTTYNNRTGAVLPQTGDETKGNRVLITATDIATAVASVDFFQGFDGTYDELELRIYDMLPAAEAQFQFRYSADGTTFDASTNNYYYGSVYATASAAAGILTTGSAIFSGNAAGNAAGYPFYGIFRLRLRDKGALFWQWHGWNSTNVISNSGAGSWSVPPGSPPAPKGLRFMMNGGGNIMRGSFRLYGIKK